jgi:purine-binding chemotaxis protein CheW
MQQQGNVQITTFRVADELFGVNALQVQEILPYQKIAPVPLSPDYIKGLINLRGQIVTVLDLRKRLGFASLENEIEGSNLIIASAQGEMSLFVDEIRNIVEVPPEKLLPPPGTVRGVASQYIKSVCQLQDELLIVLDLESTVGSTTE